MIGLLVQALSGFGLTAADFYVRLSDRTLWLHYLASLGLDEARSKSVLGAVDKYEKMGDDAFKAYTDAHGPLPEETKARILAFLKIKSLAALETVLAPLGGEALTARLGDWRKLLGGLAAMGLGAYVEVDFGVVRGLAYYTGFVFEAFDRKGELRAIAGGGRYDDLVEKLGGPALPAVGFAIGDVTMGLLLEQRGLMPAFGPNAEVYVVIGGEAEADGGLWGYRRSARGGLSRGVSAQGSRLRQAVQGGRRVGREAGLDLRRRRTRQGRGQAPRSGRPQRTRGAAAGRG